MGKITLFGIFSHTDEYKKHHFIFRDCYNRNLYQSDEKAPSRDASCSQLERINSGIEIKSDIDGKIKITCPFYASHNKAFTGAPGPHLWKCATIAETTFIPGTEYRLECTWRKFDFTKDEGRIVGWTILVKKHSVIAQ